MKKAQKAITVVASVAAAVLLFAAAQRLVMPKYQKGILEGSMIAEYYSDKAPHEVIMIGDCELYENISTVELYREYGISSYIRGSAQQLVWQSYYLLEDTLRYETPKVVIYNVMELKYNEPQNESYNRMTLDGMRWSSAKIDSINASMTQGEHFIDYVFPILRFHSRWNELTADDFRHFFSKDNVTANGYLMRVDTRPQSEFPPAPRLTDYTLGENAMDYLQRMTDLCRENGITLLLVKAPVEYPYWYDEWDEQVEAFAEENGLQYLNFIELRDEIGMDMTTDTYDAGLHLNISGAEKLARFLGAYLTENFELTDYRNDPEVASLWEDKIEFYEDLRNRQLAELEQYGELRSWGINAVEDVGGQ